MDKIQNFMGMDGFHWFVGVVESRQDPSQLGRVQVRCLGFHTDDLVDLPTQDLPWAQVMTPTTSSANSGIGTSPSFIIEGTWVVGFFMDPEKQQLVVMGSLPGIPTQEIDIAKGFNDPNAKYPKELLQSDVNKLARGTNTITKTPDIITGEPDNPYNAVYPNNHVFESESGHVIEIDDTTDAERIHVYHKSGSFVEFHPNGDVVTQHKNGFRTVTGNDNIHVTGDLTIKADGNIKIDCGVNKTINLNSGENGAARLSDTTLDNDTELNGNDIGSITSSSKTVIIGD
jgi:hypothetical protein|tara:strand:+ start:1260 stop:2117 length:858 start_codon:yes stop_codon:yes gene_type:complete